MLILILFILASCGQVSMTETTSLKEYTIDEYRIVYAKKIGPAGPPFYQYDVYKKGKYLSYTSYFLNGDSCQLLFGEQVDHYLIFNLCNKSKTILKPDKKDLDFDEIDSITIRPYDSIRITPRDTYAAPFYDTIITKNFDPTITKTLTPAQIKDFIQRWNKSSVTGYEPRDTINFDYLLTVFEKESKRKFKTLNLYIYEDGKWSYKSKDDNYFDKVWNGHE
jgi:hypothetical protein